MKVTIDIDLSPQEARETLGLPDVRKLQEDWFKAVEEKIMAEADKFSPESIIRNWTAAASGNLEGCPAC